MKRTTQPPLSPRHFEPAIPESVAQVVLRSLALNPAQRYDSATDFSTALKKALTDEPFQEPVVGLENRITKDFVVGSPPESTAQPVSQPLQQQTVDFTPPAPIAATPHQQEPKEILLNLWGNPLWPAVIGASIATIALVWGGSAFGFGMSPARPTETSSIEAIAPTPSNTPSFIPTPTPTSTTTPTETAAPLTSTPTDTPIPPTSTATQTSAPPTPTPTVEATLSAALPSATATSTVPAGVITLLKPLSLEEPSYGPTDFEWEWTGDVPPGYGFEVRVWQEGEPSAGIHNAVEDNQNGRIIRVDENRYRLSVDIKNTAGVRNRTGEYLWTVALVQISPNYADLGQQAAPARLRFEAGGGGGGKDTGGTDGGVS
jgi:hypothetical protein